MELDPTTNTVSDVPDIDATLSLDRGSSQLGAWGMLAVVVVLAGTVSVLLAAALRYWMM